MLCSCSSNTAILKEGQITKEDLAQVTELPSLPDQVELGPLSYNVYDFKARGKINGNKTNFVYNSSEQPDDPNLSFVAQKVVEHIDFNNVLTLEEKADYFHYWIPFICNFYIFEFETCKCHYNSTGMLSRIKYQDENMDFELYISNVKIGQVYLPIIT